MRPFARTALTSVAIVAALTGCTLSTDNTDIDVHPTTTPAWPDGPDPAIAEVAGEQLHEAQLLFRGDLRITYDLSSPVLGIDPSGSLTSDYDWTVVAACAIDQDGPGSAIGVIRSAGATSTIVADAKDGAYQHLLVECSGNTGSPYD